MQIQIVDNRSTKLGDVVRPEIARSEECKIAVAFVSKKGIAQIKDAFYECLQNGGNIEFLIGLDLAATDPSAVWTLFEISQTECNASVYCFSNPAKTATYHPKLYIIKTHDIANLVIGSSNLTEGGMKNNVEINALIRAAPAEEVVSDVYAIYNSLKYLPTCITPDEELLGIYDKIYAERKKLAGAITQNSRYHQLDEQFHKKLAQLPRPPLTIRDLHGWQKLVYEQLPNRPFRTRDIYRFAEEFQRYYPENRNIKPKIRQVLQQLRDLGIIRHIARETWVKERIGVTGE